MLQSTTFLSQALLPRKVVTRWLLSWSPELTSPFRLLSTNLWPARFKSITFHGNISRSIDSSGPCTPGSSPDLVGGTAFSGLFYRRSPLLDNLTWWSSPCIWTTFTHWVETLRSSLHYFIVKALWSQFSPVIHSTTGCSFLSASLFVLRFYYYYRL